MATMAAVGQDRGDAAPQGTMRAYRPSVPGTKALVTAAHPLAAMAGAQPLMKGGSAANAAVAVAATLNVVEPQEMDHTVRVLPEFTAAVGGMQGILVDERKGTMAAGADPRRAGYAAGW